MSRFSKSASVVANPWFALDHKGRPCGVIPVEPREVGGHLGFVGAKVDREKTTPSHKPRGQVVPTAQDTVYAFSETPVRVPRTPYYRELIKQGNLFAADKSTAEWAGLKKFVEPQVRLAESKLAAEASFEKEYGEGSLADLRSTAAPAEREAPPKAAKPTAEASGASAPEATGAVESPAEQAADETESNTAGAGRSRKGRN